MDHFSNGIDFLCSVHCLAFWTITATVVALEQDFLALNQVSQCLIPV